MISCIVSHWHHHQLPLHRVSCTAVTKKMFWTRYITISQFKIELVNTEQVSALKHSHARASNRVILQSLQLLCPQALQHYYNHLKWLIARQQQAHYRFKIILNLTMLVSIIIMYYCMYLRTHFTETICSRINLLLLLAAILMTIAIWKGQIQSTTEHTIHTTNYSICTTHSQCLFLIKFVSEPPLNLILTCTCTSNIVIAAVPKSYIF